MALKSLEIGDTITSQITVTNGYHDGGVGTLLGSNYTTSSLSSTQKKYYYNLQYNSKDHFSVTYGHKAGSGSSVQTATTEGETKSIYRQFYNITETDSERLRDTTGWLMVDGTNSTNAVTQSDVYIVAAERLQMKDRLNPGTWTMKLSGSITGTANKATSSFLTLTDNSKTTAPSSAPFGERYDIVSGSAGTVVVAASTKTYGFFYPDAGIMVFSANALSSSLPGTKGFIQSGSGFAKSGTVGNGFAQDLRTVSAADNANKMRIALQGLEELKKHLDTNIIVPNQNIFKIINEKTTLKNSFGLSNDVLKFGVQSVTDLMVRPGLVNLDFADVETVMKGMGKAMMGTGEAEGDKRAEEATNAALNNPLIDEYSLRGAKGLLVNITGGSDLTTFEVDEAVNKIRAEVDPEAELIFGSIEDPNLNGKIRVSIVATSLDGQEPETKPVVSMVHRLHNRNTGYSNNSTSNIIANQETLNATEGATALDIRTDVEPDKSINQKGEQELTQQPSQEEASLENISIESATYMENIPQQDEIPNFEVESIELATPQLFSDDESISSLNDENNTNIISNVDDRKEFETKENLESKEPLLFEDSEAEDNFEIP